MEQMLHYVWKHRIFPLQKLVTVDGRELEVLHPGIQNRDAGPDFTGAKVVIDGVVWVGNVEIHERTSDWFRHHHDEDERYDNIILHVAGIVDCDLHYRMGSGDTKVPQLELKVPEYVMANYDDLLRADHEPRCADIIPSFSSISLHSWMAALEVERLQMRTEQIEERRRMLNLNWEDTLFVTIARSFGFGHNGDVFERWAHSIPMGAAAKHRDSLFQIEALFFGQAGLLENTECRGGNAEESEDPYFRQLQTEYRFLRQKFSLTPINGAEWKLLRMRPQQFPHIKIAQLAVMYCEQKVSLSALVNADDIQAMMQMLTTRVSDYWRTHYTFRKEHTQASSKALSVGAKRLVLLNCVAPMLFAYGRYKGDEAMCERALMIWEQLPAEDNRVIRHFVAAGIVPECAADTQALMQLNANYCERHDCLRCRMGEEFVRRTPGFLREER